MSFGGIVIRLRIAKGLYACVFKNFEINDDPPVNSVWT